MAVFKRGKIYWFEFKWRGEKVRESTKQTNEKAAIRAERQRKLELENGYNRLAQSPTSNKFADAANNFIDTQAHWAERTCIINRSRLQHLLPVFGKKFLDEIDADLINRYRTGRKKQTNNRGGLTSNRTINMEINLLRQVLKKHKQWSQVADEVKRLPENKDTGVALESDAVDRLLEVAKKSASRQLYPAILISLHTTLRNEELRLLKWEQVDLINGTIRVGKSKTEGGKGRIIPLSQLALQTFRDWRTNFPDAQPSHFVFPAELYVLVGVKGKLGRGNGIMQARGTDPTRPMGTWKDAFAKAKKKAGVKCRWHDLRHTAISTLAAAGAMDATLQSIAGWMSPKMIETYSHVRNQAKIDAVRNAFDGPSKFIQ
jgi:integrase